MEKQIVIHNLKSGIMQLKFRENNLKCQINKSQSRENAEGTSCPTAHREQIESRPLMLLSLAQRHSKLKNL